MWLNMILLTVASLCVGFILGWIVARPRRWESAAGKVGEDQENWLPDAGPGR